MEQTLFKDVEYYPKTRIFKGTLDFSSDVKKKFILVFSQDFKKVESGTVVVSSPDQPEMNEKIDLILSENLS